MIINRRWAMPNKNTFSIKPIYEFIAGKLSAAIADGALVIIDPFANESKFSHLCSHTNDIDNRMPTTHHMDALEFLRSFDDSSVDFVLFDPPYSPRQVSECYRAMDMSVNMQTTQASFWGNMKKEISRIVKDGGCCITFGWNSGGIGKSFGFEIAEILMVAHGGWHNDTICTFESKIK